MAPAPHGGRSGRQQLAHADVLDPVPEGREHVQQAAATVRVGVAPARQLGMDRRALVLPRQALEPIGEGVCHGAPVQQVEGQEMLGAEQALVDQVVVDPVPLKFNIDDATPGPASRLAFSPLEGERQGLRGAATCHEIRSDFAEATDRRSQHYEPRKMR